MITCTKSFGLKIFIFIKNIILMKNLKKNHFFYKIIKVCIKKIKNKNRPTNTHTHIHYYHWLLKIWYELFHSICIHFAGIGSQACRIVTWCLVRKRIKLTPFLVISLSEIVPISFLFQLVLMWKQSLFVSLLINQSIYLFIRSFNIFYLL